MGNRAVITDNGQSIGIYVHWNGDIESIEAFTTYCKLKGYRTPTSDNYGWARLTQVIANFFGGESSIGIDSLQHLDTNNYDNGVYVLDGWRVKARVFARSSKGHEQGFSWTVDELLSWLKGINEVQPVREQIEITPEQAETLAEELNTNRKTLEYIKDGKAWEKKGPQKADKNA